MSDDPIICPRCGELVDCAPDGCRDWSCPKTEIEDAFEEQADEIAWHILRGNLTP